MIKSPSNDADIIPYPQPDLENPYITGAIKDAIQADKPEWQSVYVPPGDFPEMRKTCDRLKGHYINYEGSIVGLSLVIYQ